MIIKMKGHDLLLDANQEEVEFDVTLDDDLLEKGVTHIVSVENGMFDDAMDLIDVSHATRRAKEIITAMKGVAQLERDASRMGESI